MPATYEPIATTTLSSAQSAITFSSIPGTYTDLRIVLVAYGPTSGISTFIPGLRFNSDTSTNYSGTHLNGDGASATSLRQNSVTMMRTTLANQYSFAGPCLYEIDIFSYTVAANKTVLVKVAQDKNGSGNVTATVGLWRNTAAITNIDLQNISSGAYQAGTTATLYGIKAA